MMSMILEVLEKMKTEYTKEKETICVSHGPVDLYKFINEIFNGYRICPRESVVRAILSLSFKMISIFQSEFKTLVQEDDQLTLEVFGAMANSNLKFISCTRQFIDICKRDSGLMTEQLNRMFSYDKVLKNFAEISNIAFCRIQNLVLDLMNRLFVDVKDHRKFDLNEFLGVLFESAKPMF